MKNEEIIANVKKYDWHFWLDRPFGLFVASLFGPGKEVYEKIGLPVEFDAFVFQDGGWYESKQVFEKMEVAMKEYLKTHSLFEVTKKMEKFHREKKKRIVEMAADKKGNAIEQLKELRDIFLTVTAFIWVTHALEDHYNKVLQSEVPKYVKENVDLFIGDASFPEKKTAQGFFEEAMRNGEKPEKIAQEYGWIRARDGFADPFTVEEIKELTKNLKPATPHKEIDVPKQLQKLFTEVKELVYFRTYRTDVFYELLFLARPIFKRVAKHYNFSYDNFKHYSIQDLINGNPQPFKEANCICYKGEIFCSNKRILNLEKQKETGEIKGVIAQKGIARGIAKIVKTVGEIEKVQEGDVLVTQMTFPSYIAAMQKASAFVTDEGGITCHAAIIAREMKKPCIIGTKNATLILKDGDKVEVNADKGIVRKLK